MWNRVKKFRATKSPGSGFTMSNFNRCPTIWHFCSVKDLKKWKRLMNVHSALSTMITHPPAVIFWTKLTHACWNLRRPVSISSKTTHPRDTTRRGQQPSQRDNHCAQNPSPRQNRESKAPPRDIKLENFTNISINSDTV